LAMTEQGQFPNLPPIDERVPLEEEGASGKARVLRADRRQGRWQVTPLDEVLPAYHPVRTVWAFVESLDLSEYLAAVRSVEGRAGRPAIDPAILLGLWLYGISQGVGSARELERLTKEHDAYRWLCGGVSVNYHTLSDFRNGEAKLDQLLTKWLASLTKAGVLKLERVSQDGMRVRASAGASSFRRRERLQDYLLDAAAQIERLKSESGTEGAGEAAQRTARQEAAQKRAARERHAQVKRALQLLGEAEKALEGRTDKKKPPEARTSTTDPEARVMKMADGGFRPAFNAQVACDTDSRLVVGVDVVNVGSDMSQIPPMLDQLRRCFGKLPQELLCDGGYPSKGSLEAAHTLGVDVYSPVPKPPHGGDRYAPRADDSEARAAWRERMSRDEAKALYKLRAATIEWVNACFRRSGLTAFLVRGLSKARAVLLLIALSHNLFRLEAMKLEAATASAA
jgi:transposase